MVFCTMLDINVAVNRVSFPETVVRDYIFTSTCRLRGTSRHLSVIRTEWELRISLEILSH